MPRSLGSWLSDIISPRQVNELTTFQEIKVVRGSSLCLLCKGGRRLCGKISCPIIAKAQSLAKTTLRITSPHIQGSTPPGVFVGRLGYPKVFIGPMVPPFTGDTEILDTPELWMGKGIQEIIDYRFSLIRGKAVAHISEASTGTRLLDSLQELALGRSPVEAEVVLAKIPQGVLTLGSDIQPFGPSAPLRSFNASNVSVDRRLERAFYDRDLRASEAVVELYDNGVYVTRIQRAFSLGMFGLGKNRKLVPTRWSITAVDSIVSQELINRIKENDTIDEYRVYSFSYLDSRYVAILMPEKWSFEWIEAWFPGTTWNPDRGSPEPAMMGDFESYWGRNIYPDVGGCYYSCRLAVAEKLCQEKRQAAALVLREIHPGYILPVGVWNVRESIRQMLKGEPEKFDNFTAALNSAMAKLTIPLKNWIRNSQLLRQSLYQKKITEFV
ncbi:MAG: Nre family DNA repair protein [Candidatus Hadarchaeum sp.]|uniref:Nre family DNA repair protein n=1 Tax=Candidatus Hadarchaeum sp. TaxID=2883567 RepID=UPI003D120339